VARRTDIAVRLTRPGDFEGIGALTAAVYPGSPPWSPAQLGSHLRVFPEGQFVAIAGSTGEIVGMAASLIVLWDDYEMESSWRDFTDTGMFTNHDPVRGHTLYGAEVMVRPDRQGSGVGSRLYDVRTALVRRLGLWRIRAGARLRGYHQHAATMSPREYVDRVVRGELRDPTLSFQLHRGFRVLDIVAGYLRQDHESLGHAAVIEWLNPDIAR
jgi:GNAT superfamily N-acetyltransferase